MDFPTYLKSVEAQKFWEQDRSGFPDPRDPSFQGCLVSAGVTAQEYEKAIVCLKAWREGRQNLYRACMSVAHVFRNRSLDESGRWKNSIYLNAVADEGQTANCDVFPDEQDPEFAKMLEYIDRLYEGTLLDTTEGSVYYANISTLPKQNLQSRKSYAGTMVFY